MAHNAKSGGEIGANGEYYKGGQFVADNPNTAKGMAQKKGQRKIQIAPYKWVIAKENEFAIISQCMVGAVSVFKRAGGWNDYSEIELVENAEELCQRNCWDIDHIKSFIARYNAGERIYKKIMKTLKRKTYIIRLKCEDGEHLISVKVPATQGIDTSEWNRLFMQNCQRDLFSFIDYLKRIYGCEAKQIKADLSLGEKI